MGSFFVCLFVFSCFVRVDDTSTCEANKTKSCWFSGAHAIVRRKCCVCFFFPEPLSSALCAAFCTTWVCPAMIVAHMAHSVDIFTLKCSAYYVSNLRSQVMDMSENDAHVPNLAETVSRWLLFFCSHPPLLNAIAYVRVVRRYYTNSGVYSMFWWSALSPCAPRAQRH